MRPGFKKAAIYAAVISAAIAAEIAILHLCFEREDEEAPQAMGWPVMGTVAQMTSRKHVDELEFGELYARVQASYSRVEKLLSAWNPESELSRLSAAGCTNWTEAASPEVRPCYKAALRLAEDADAPVFELIDRKKLRRLAQGELNPVDTPWFGQLMAGPQLLGFLWQVNTWLRERNVRIEV